MTLKGNIKHSACRWCYESIPLEEFCKESVQIGLKGIDLLKPSEWQTVLNHDLEVSMANPEEFSLEVGFNQRNNHRELQKTYLKLIKQVADHGIKNLICFSGNRNGITDQEGWDECLRGLEPLVLLAEIKQVTLCMELLNSQVDHPDYQCDHTAWGIELCNKINSPNFKLLYDIYHMQIMEGNIIATIRQNASQIAHYHTGGVPGRNEIDFTQELNYPAIMTEIVDSGYEGYVAQEFIPTAKNPLASLRKAISICDV